MTERGKNLVLLLATVCLTLLLCEAALRLRHGVYPFGFDHRGARTAVASGHLRPTRYDSTLGWALKVPLEERFHIFTEHAPVDLVINQTYLGIERSADAIVVQVTLNEGRDAEVKRGFYRTLADLLRERIGLRQEDLVINLVEVKRENWSFGNGKAQLV